MLLQQLLIQSWGVPLEYEVQSQCYEKVPGQPGATRVPPSPAVVQPRMPPKAALALLPEQSSKNKTAACYTPQAVSLIAEVQDSKFDLKGPSECSSDPCATLDQDCRLPLAPPPAATLFRHPGASRNSKLLHRPFRGLRQPLEML